MSIVNSVFKKLYAFGQKPKIISWASKSPRRASLYYFLFSQQFDKEHVTVLSGRHSFYHDPASVGKESMLRRNVHRIEKGLSVFEGSRKSYFAEDFIMDTVSALSDYLSRQPDQFNSKFLKWVFDVLITYFERVSHTPKIKKAHETFEGLRSKLSKELHFEGALTSIPYSYSLLPIIPVQFEDFYLLLKRRHSVRWYTDEVVPLEKLYQAVEASLTAPSACNRQPFRVIIVQGEKDLEKVRKLPLGFDTFSNNINTFMMVVGNLSAYFDERDKHLIYVDGSLFAMTLMLVLESMGLSSCPINYPDSDALDRMVSNFFGLKSYERGVLSLSVGYARPEGKIPYSQKKSANNIITVF